jgi:hypothetical protein
MAASLVHKQVHCCLNAFQVETKIRAGKQWTKLCSRQHNATRSVGAHSVPVLLSRWNGNPEVTLLLVFRLFSLTSVY